MISKMILAMIVSILRAKFRERFDDCFSRGRKILLKTNSVNALIPVADVQFYKNELFNNTMVVFFGLFLISISHF